jgi:hypothetical protein
MRRAVLILALVAAACNGGGQKPDGADGDGVDAGDNGTTEEFRLVFSEGARACGVFVDYRPWQEELELLGMLHFRPQTVSLPIDQASFVADLIEEVEFGPGRVVPAPKGPGAFDYEFQDWGDPQNGCHHYEFRQSFDLEGWDFWIIMGVDFCLNDGIPFREEIQIGEDFSDQIYQLSGVVADQHQRYAPCEYRDLTLFIITAEVQGGDRAVLHKRHEIPMAGSGPCNIVHAEVIVDGQSRAVDDYFLLVYAAEHHNWNENYAVLLDPPVGEVHAVLLQEHNLWQPPEQMIYLDADLQEIRRTDLQSYDEVEQ